MRIINSKTGGFSLVELMVAITISLFLSIGLVTVMANTTRSFNIQDDVSRLTENARFALEFLRRDIRMGGYFGCHDDPSNVNNVVNAAGETLWSSTLGLEGFEGGTLNWLPSGTAYSEYVFTNGVDSDAITLRFANPSSEIELNSPVAINTDNVDIDGNGEVGSNEEIQPGSIWLISDCSNADIFQVTNPTSGTSTTVLHGASGTPGNSTSQFANVYGLSEFDLNTPVLMQLRAIRYFVGLNADNIPTLQREEITTASGAATVSTIDVIEGVDSLQLRYGEDTDSDGDVDFYRDADAVTSWGNVRSVQVGLLLRSVEEYGDSHEESTGTYSVLGTSFDDPDDARVRRRVYTNTIALRN